MVTLQKPPVRMVPSPPKFHVIPESDAEILRMPDLKPNTDRGDDRPGNTKILVYSCSVRRRDERTQDR